MSLIKRSEILTYHLRFKHFNLILSSLSYKKGEALDNTTSFKVKSAGLLSIKEEDEMEEWMDVEIKKQVKYFIQNKYYTVRLLLSALAFLLIYLFCSLVIRDPIPMFDELLLGFGGAILTWILLDRKEGNGAVAHKLKLDLKDLYAQKNTEQSETVEQIEAFIYELESEFDPITLSDVLSGVEKRAISKLELNNKTEEGEIKELLSLYLSKHHSLNTLYKKVKSNKGENKTLAAHIYSSHQSGCDVYLLTLCLLLLG